MIPVNKPSRIRRHPEIFTCSHGLIFFYKIKKRDEYVDVGANDSHSIVARDVTKIHTHFLHKFKRFVIIICRVKVGNIVRRIIR